jgi:acyl carrier protein
MSEPCVDVEGVVSEVWREVLKVGDAAPNDNFLDLGGNSLRAGEIASRLRAALGVEVPIDVVLSEESFASFSRAVHEMVQQGAVR